LRHRLRRRPSLPRRRTRTHATIQRPRHTRPTNPHTQIHSQLPQERHPMTPPPDRTRRLGKGLGALLSSNTTLENRANETSAPQALPIDKIRPNPYQPRKEFRPEDLADLEASLRSSGLLQPITVRPSPSGTGYELIAGERRFRAASRLGWKEIPAIVREIDRSEEHTSEL